ncbi:MAG TPA: cellulase family glycosylhydrolase [Ktedonobacteraceae bacterium]|nr:cellulase family glycosylhydrolase [Ktedonobacteraceae bacterium]
MSRHIVTIGLVILAALAIWAGILVYMQLYVPQPQIGGGTGTGGSPGAVTCGVRKTSNGYTFSWLHVAHGYFVNDEGCIINLRGFNWSQLEFGNAVGGGPKTRISEEGIAWYSQTFHTNVWRIPVNTTWWNENVYVPLAQMNYQDWIGQVIKWAENYGNYVILTKGPQFQNPPCGGSVKQCPTQNQAKRNYQQGLGGPEDLTTGQYIQPAITMWQSIAGRYANDPAVLYDSWNEMNSIDAQTWYHNTNILIETIRAQNPRSLIFLGGPNYKGDVNPIIHGDVPNFAESNLVYDFHVYDGFQGLYGTKNCSEPLSYVWQRWPGNANEQVGFSQRSDKAVAFTEWGGCNDFAQYNQAITTYAHAYHICLVYYDETNVATKVGTGYQLNENGTRVQAAYAAL